MQGRVPSLVDPRGFLETTVHRAFHSLFVAALLSPLAASAAGVSCHCFRDRSFDATSPAAVDPYVLATTQNSLLAAEFGIPKNSVVRAKMTGTDGGQLWVAHYLARSNLLDAEELLSQRFRTESWAAALQSIDATLPPALSPAHTDAELTAAVVDQVVGARLGAMPETLRDLRGAGARDAEVIAAVYLGLRSKMPPGALLKEVRAGRASWGSILDATGLPAEGISEDLTRRLR